MHIVLWVLAGLLSALFLGSGGMKLIQPKESLSASGLGWVEDFSPGTLKAIGALEVTAAVGLILPAALDIAPVLVPLAAVGLVLVMAGAVLTHLRRKETQVIGVPLVLLALAAFVAWGRLGPEPFTG